MTPSSSSNTFQSQLDIGRYTRVHKSPQVVQTPTPIQPEETNFSPVTNQPINYDQFQPNLTQQNKESDSESESEVWSFDRAINEVFRLLPPELCPKPLSGIKQLMESRSTPLLVLPQSKLVENTTKYIQNRLDSDKCSRDWICPQSLVSALAPTIFYKSQNQYLPADNIHCNLVLTRLLGSKKADRVSGDYRVIILGVPTVIISSSNNVYPTHQYCDILKCWFQCMYCWQKEKYVLDQ